MDFVDHWPAVWNLEMGKNECEQESVDSPQVFYYIQSLFEKVYKNTYGIMHPLYSLDIHWGLGD